MEADAFAFLRGGESVGADGFVFLQGGVQAVSRVVACHIFDVRSKNVGHVVQLGSSSESAPGLDLGCLVAGWGSLAQGLGFQAGD